MRLTQVHVLYWAARAAPPRLRPLVQKVTVDDCINAHAGPRDPRVAVSEPHNTLVLLRSFRKRGQHIEQLMALAEQGRSVHEAALRLGARPAVHRRNAFAVKWAAKIMKARTALAR